MEYNKLNVQDLGRGRKLMVRNWSISVFNKLCVSIHLDIAEGH